MSGFTMQELVAILRGIPQYVVCCHPSQAERIRQLLDQSDMRHVEVKSTEFAKMGQAIVINRNVTTFTKLNPLFEMNGPTDKEIQTWLES